MSLLGGQNEMFVDETCRRWEGFNKGKFVVINRIHIKLLEVRGGKERLNKVIWKFIGQ